MELITHEKTQKELFGICYQLTRDVEKAKDLSQTVNLKAIKGNYEEQGTPIAWLRQIAKNEFINMFRKERNRRNAMELYPAANMTTKNEAESNLGIERINEALDKLSPVYKETIELLAKGMSYEEIAKEADVPIGTIKSRVFFGRKKLLGFLSRI